MTTPTITVVVDLAVPSRAAVRWAVREASRRQAHLRIVLPGGRADRADREHLDASAAVAARRSIGVSFTSWPDPTVQAKLAASADTELLVLPGPTADVDRLVMGAHCPVVVVPDAPARRERPHAGLPRHPRDPRPVLVGAGPATEPEVLGFAFAEAARRRAGLLAVRTWNDPLVELGLLLPGHVDRWDVADEHAREDLALQLSACRVAYPEVALEQLVVNDRCADLLAALAQRARLLVLGRPARGTLLNGVAMSPAITLARHVPCPVVIVPPLGTTHGGWWPTRPVGLADLRG